MTKKAALGSGMSPPKTGKSEMLPALAEEIHGDGVLHIDAKQLPTTDLKQFFGHPDGYVEFDNGTILRHRIGASPIPALKPKANAGPGEGIKPLLGLRAQQTTEAIVAKPFGDDQIKQMMLQLTQAHAQKAGLTISISDGALDLLVDASADSLRNAVQTMRRALPGSDASAESSSWRIEVNSSGDQPTLNAVPSS